MTAADWRCIIPLLAADALLCALWVVAACMRSSQISRQQEEKGRLR